MKLEQKQLLFKCIKSLKYKSLLQYLIIMWWMWLEACEKRPLVLNRELKVSARRGGGSNWPGHHFISVLFFLTYSFWPLYSKPMNRSLIGPVSFDSLLYSRTIIFVISVCPSPVTNSIQYHISYHNTQVLFR